MVLAGIDLEIGAGAFVTLLGPSGSGKTTLLRIIAGFAEPDAGDVLVAGRSILRDAPERRPVNTVFQNYALFPHLTVWKNIAFGLEVSRVPAREVRERVDAAIEMVRLGVEGRRVDELSGGQQQRVALGRAAVNRPGSCSPRPTAGRARSQAQARDATGAPSPAARARHDVHLRHA